MRCQPGTFQDQQQPIPRCGLLNDGLTAGDHVSIGPENLQPCGDPALYTVGCSLPYWLEYTGYIDVALYHSRDPWPSSRRHA